MIKITDNIVADARSKGMRLNDFLSEHYESEIADKISKNPQLKQLTPVQFAMRDAGLNKYSLVKDFFTSGNDLLFPAVVEQKIVEVVDQSNILNSILAGNKTVNSKKVNTLHIDMTKPENKKQVRLRHVVEGSDLPVAKIIESESAINLYKYGVAVESTYEAIEYSTLDMFSETLRHIGTTIASQELGDAISILLKGDGNNNAAPIHTTTGATLTPNEITNFMIDFYDATDGLTANVFVCGKQMYFDLANMLIDSGEQNSYRIGTAFRFPQHMFSDLTVIYNKNIPNASDDKPQLIALNKENALNKFTAANSNISEMSRNIRNQTQLGTISEIVGFGKSLNEASRILKLA